MNIVRGTRLWVVALCVTAVLSVTAAPAQGAASDPLFVYVPAPPPNPFEPHLPPPVAYFYGPCGIGVDSAGRFYVSDYYHHAIDVFKPNDANYTNPSNTPTGYITQLANVDPLDGPCGLAFDAADNLYVNNYHRSVEKFGAIFSFGSGTAIAGAGADATHPTGVDVDPTAGYVYVDHRTYVAVYDSTGVAVEEGGEPVRIGDGTLEDGYGIAFSRYPGTAGYLYVPDAATNKVKVFDPATDKVNPVAEINGSGTPNGAFVSLRDAAIAVDRVSGDVYVVDNLQPEYTERPQAIIYVFDSGGAYKGHLKYKIIDALPAGLAVDNSPGATHPAGTQGRVYVTSGNLDQAGVYAYPPGAATTASPLPPTVQLVLSTSERGGGTVTAGAPLMLDCSTRCEEEIRAGTQVSLTGNPDPGFTFIGWSGACIGAEPTCALTMDEAASVRAIFTAPSPAETFAAEEGAPEGAPAAASGAQSAVRRRRLRRHHRGHHHRGRHHGKSRRHSRRHRHAAPKGRCC